MWSSHNKASSVASAGDNNAVSQQKPSDAGREDMKCTAETENNKFCRCHACTCCADSLGEDIVSVGSNKPAGNNMSDGILVAIPSDLLYQKRHRGRYAATYSLSSSRGGGSASQSVFDRLYNDAKDREQWRAYSSSRSVGSSQQRSVGSRSRMSVATIGCGAGGGAVYERLYRNEKRARKQRKPFNSEASSALERRLAYSRRTYNDFTREKQSSRNTASAMTATREDVFDRLYRDNEDIQSCSRLERHQRIFKTDDVNTSCTPSQMKRQMAGGVSTSRPSHLVSHRSDLPAAVQEESMDALLDDLLGDEFPAEVPNDNKEGTEDSGNLPEPSKLSLTSLEAMLAPAQNEYLEILQDECAKMQGSSSLEIDGGGLADICPQPRSTAAVGTYKEEFQEASIAANPNFRLSQECVEILREECTKFQTPSMLDQDSTKWETISKSVDDESIGTKEVAPLGYPRASVGDAVTVMANDKIAFSPNPSFSDVDKKLEESNSKSAEGLRENQSNSLIETTAYSNPLVSINDATVVQDEDLKILGGELPESDKMEEDFRSKLAVHLNQVGKANPNESLVDETPALKESQEGLEEETTKLQLATPVLAVKKAGPSSKSAVDHNESEATEDDGYPNNPIVCLGDESSSQDEISPKECTILPSPCLLAEDENKVKCTSEPALEGVRSQNLKKKSTEPQNPIVLVVNKEDTSSKSSVKLIDSNVDTVPTANISLDDTNLVQNDESNFLVQEDGLSSSRTPIELNESIKGTEASHSTSLGGAIKGQNEHLHTNGEVFSDAPSLSLLDQDKKEAGSPISPPAVELIESLKAAETVPRISLGDATPVQDGCSEIHTVELTRQGLPDEPKKAKGASSKNVVVEGEAATFDTNNLASSPGDTISLLGECGENLRRRDADTIIDLESKEYDLSSQKQAAPADGHPEIIASKISPESLDDSTQASKPSLDKQLKSDKNTSNFPSEPGSPPISSDMGVTSSATVAEEESDISEPASAVKIQTWWRGTDHRKQYLEMQEYAVVMQAVCRGYLCRLTSNQTVLSESPIEKDSGLKLNDETVQAADGNEEEESTHSLKVKESSPLQGHSRDAPPSHLVDVGCCVWPWSVKREEPLLKEAEYLEC